jgi:hypothetical protein
MVTFNPFVITNIPDGFSVQSQGFWQGDVQADPAQRFQLAAGVVAANEVLPMWGGIAVYEQTPATSAAVSGVAPTIGRALSAPTISGFSTFQGSFSAPTTPQSTVPLQGTGGGFNFVRLGSLSRVVVACSSAVLTLAGSNNPQNLSWDPVNQILVPFSALTTPVAITSITWAGGVATVTATAHGLVTGNFATISGAIPVGYNVSGAVTRVSNDVFTIPVPIDPGPDTTPGSVTPGLGGFSATLLEVNAGNSAVVSYNSGTGFATWNTTGNAALILI